MEHQEIKSSAMKSVGYHDGTLEIKWNGGKVHQYHGVSPEIHQAFMAAESKGKFFAQKIRGQFKESAA